MNMKMKQVHPPKQLQLSPLKEKLGLEGRVNDFYFMEC